MNLQELQQLLDAAGIGRTLLSICAESHLEAFSRNALLCWRGMPTMKKYKTVKEVCDLTGLTRKHLYYFHHENVVRAAAYANYSVEGYNGYKLYDDWSDARSDIYRFYSDIRSELYSGDTDGAADELLDFKNKIAKMK